MLYAISYRRDGKQMEDKRIIFTGGGTAGHVMVNLALIPYFLESGWQVSYIGSEDGIEKELIESIDNVTYYPIATGKLRRYMSIENFKDPFKVLKGIMQAWRIIGQVKPSIIFSKGGFVSVPVVLAAKLRRVPTIIHESDVTPGLANKISIPFTKQVLTTFPETVKYLPENKTTYVGAVVREQLFQGNKVAGFRLTKLDESKPVLLVMGGSAGSQKINTVVRKSLDRLLEDFHIVHVCGRDAVDPSLDMPGYVQFEYIDQDLKHIFAITDLVVSRAGANAIFEFLSLRIPMLLIPLSLAASRGDQIDNARSFAKQNYALVLEEEQLNKTTLPDYVNKLRNNASIYLDNMGKYSRKKSRDQVIEIIKTYCKN